MTERRRRAVRAQIIPLGRGAHGQANDEATTQIGGPRARLRARGQFRDRQPISAGDPCPTAPGRARRPARR
jgi:hypothetical protein